MEKSEKQKRSGKTKIIIALMFLGLMSPKAWGYAEKELSPSFSENTFSSGDTLSSDDTFSLSRAVLTDEKGVAICQVNLVENPQFLPQFAEAGLSDLEPLDLPGCEEQSLDIVARYAEQAWVKKEVAFVPALVALGTGALVFAGGCLVGTMTWMIADTWNKKISSMEDIERQRPPSNVLPTLVGGTYGGINSLFTGLMTGWSPILLSSGMSVGLGAAGGLACSGITGLIVYE